MNYFSILRPWILCRCLEFFFIKNCCLIEIAAENHYFTLLEASAVTSCRWGEQFVIFRCHVSLWCCALKIGCCFSRSFHKIISERSRETWFIYIIMELLHANFLALAYQLFFIFAKGFCSDESSRDDILLLSSKLNDIVLVDPTAADDVATACVVEVSLYKRPRSAAGITSFLVWEDATTDVALEFIRTDVSSDLFRYVTAYVSGNSDAL